MNSRQEGMGVAKDALGKEVRAREKSRGLPCRLSCREGYHGQGAARQEPQPCDQAEAGPSSVAED